MESPMSGLFGRSARGASKETGSFEDEEVPTTSNGAKTTGRVKSHFDDEDGYAKPPRGAGKKDTRKGALANASSGPDSDELFSYGNSKPKPGYVAQNGYGHDDGEAPSEEYVNQAVQDLEVHAVKKSQDTTSTLKNCLRVANDTMSVGATTLMTLHDQGIQIERTHEKAVDLDQHLSRVRSAHLPSYDRPLEQPSKLICYSRRFIDLIL